MSEAVGTNPRVGDPLEQVLVATVEDSARLVEHCAVRHAVVVEDHLGESGVETEDVAGLHDDVVDLEDPHQLVVSDEGALMPEVRSEIDEYPASLHTSSCHAVDAEGTHTAWPDITRAVSVVEGDLVLTVAVDVVVLTDVGEAVPVLDALGQPRPRRSALRHRRRR